MNNKVRIGVLASLLLVPATLVQANEQISDIQQNKQLPFNVVANATDEEIINALEEENATDETENAAEDFVINFIEVLLTPEPYLLEDYSNKVAEARGAYNALSLEVQEVVKGYSVEGTELKALAVLQQAETNIAIVKDVVKAYETIVNNKPTTSINTLRASIENLKKADEKVPENYRHFLEDQKEGITALSDVLKIVEAINILKLDENDAYRVRVLELRDQYINVKEEFKKYIINEGKLKQAEQDIEAADDVIKEIAELGEKPNSTAINNAMSSYNKLTINQRSLVTNYNVLKAFQQANVDAASVVKKIAAIKPLLDTGFVSKVNEALASYENLDTSGKALVTNYPILEALKEYKNVVEKVVGLKLKSSSKSDVIDYESAVEEAKNVYNEVAKQPLPESLTEHKPAIDSLLQAADQKLKIVDFDVQQAKKITGAIEGLKNIEPAKLLSELSKARALYDEKYVQDTSGTSANAKKLVYNYIELTNLEKQYTAVLKVTKGIEGLPTYYGKTSLLSRIQAMQKAYANLGNMKDYVYNNAELEKLNSVVQFMTGVNALKTKDEKYEEKVTQLKTDFKAIEESFKGEEYTPMLNMLKEKYVSKLQTAEDNLHMAKGVIDKIEQLKTTTDDKVGEAIADIKAEYKKVKQKKLVTNYKDFQAIEKNYKAATKVTTLIVKLPEPSKANAKDYAKKVEAAQKAYDKLTAAQKVFVTNYNELAPVIEAAKVIGMIADLKTSSKDYLVNLEAAKAAYAKLADIDKEKVVNADLLDAGDTTKVSVEKVETLINAAIPTATDYIQKLIDARHAYDSLSKDQQRMVSNYKDLTTREKAVKPVLKLTEDIAALDPANATKFISQYKSALKAHEKLSFTDRKLVTNEQRLVTELAPIFKVMEQISLIKESSKTFVEDVTRARAAYNALSAGDKAQISNYARLLEQELNVQGGARVDEMIRAIKGSNPKDYVANVKAAREAYNALSSANKRGVTLINDLKAEESYIKPVETAIKLIEGLSNPRNDLAKQVTAVQKALAKLNNEQQSFITNMSDYTDLSSIVHVYELIQKLNPSDKYYMGNLQAARTAYERLSPDEKMRVTNYHKLQEAITNVEGVENVIKTIAGLSSTSSTYFDDVAKAVDLYKTLPSALKKQVHNYDILKNAEKNIKNAQKVISIIEQIDPTVRSFESKVKSARKAYDKLIPEEKMLVTNYTFLTRYELELGLE
ncbi:hypothetical protein [Bacillus ndiopicus]|uniref:hypothetical protein n=1 Tax=Bacillus ndiopicus TaxID=1347368 RepID=UPI0005AB2414|nr:hypothetical protein [Bacillus ndiopicus]